MTLEKERAELEEIQQEQGRLENGVRIARTAAIQQEELTHSLQTPEGLVRASDKEIEASIRDLREANRQLGKARTDLEKHLHGPAANLDGRCADLTRREKRARLADHVAVFENEVALQIQRWEAVRTGELTLEKLAEAAEFRPMRRIVNNITLEKTVLDSFHDYVCAHGLGRLLPLGNARRRHYEYLHRKQDPKAIATEHAEEERRVRHGEKPMVKVEEIIESERQSFTNLVRAFSRVV